MRVTLQEEMDTLQASLLEEGDLVLRAVRGSINALRENDPELADEVIAFDDEVDARYIALEQAIESLLARQTPVASTCASCSPSCTRISISSGWPTSV